MILPRANSSVGGEDLRAGGLLSEPFTRPIFFPTVDDSHCDRIHISLTTDYCFHDGYFKKQPPAWKEYCAEYWLKELQESMDMYTGYRDITEITFENTLEPISQSFRRLMIVIVSGLIPLSPLSIVLTMLQ